jgi:monoamine oxidase
MKVVVVGAGLSGLTAAVELTAAGVDVVVLEANERVGGRTLGIEAAPGSWADAGGAYLGERHTELTALLSAAGLKTTPTSVFGSSRFAFGGSVHTRPSRFPPLNAVALGDLFEGLDRLTSRVRSHAPWLTPDASTWDTMTAAEWAAQNLRHPDARLFFPLFLGEMMAADPADVSVLHMAFYLRSGGGVGYLNAFEGGAQAERVDGGAHQLSEYLAGELGDRVHLSQPVRAIHQDREGVAVFTSDGVRTADAAVVAIPPLLADAISYVPALPVRRSGARTGRGCAVKVHLVYPAPLWRDYGLSGWSVSSPGSLMSTVDDSPADGAAGILTGFVTGREAYQFSALPAGAQRAEVIEQVARIFPELPDPIGVHITDWVNAEFSRGCYAALFGPGDWMRQGPHLTSAHVRVHWAGTETSTEFFGLMEGAIRSGQRVAREILFRYAPQGRSR